MDNVLINDFKKEDLLFLPLGGAGEIGMNCYLYHFMDQWLMIDLGITFKDDRVESADLILPDIDFIIKRIDKLSGIILTHAHEDHIGGMPYLYKYLGNVPIYTTSFTSSVLKRKFKSEKELNLNILKYNQKFNIGCFNIEILALTHSIPEPNAVIIRTSKGNIFHTGDWKLDPKPLIGNAIDEKKIIKIQKEGILAMVCDSTNVFNTKPSGSEDDVRNNFKKIFSEKVSGKIIVTCFASNIARLETIALIANQFDRSCVLVGRSLKRMYESALENDYLNNVPKFLEEKEAKNIPEENLVLICTGSQGESRAALHKLISGKNSNFSIYNSDLVVFSSREIPGNEKQINYLKEILVKSNCQYIDDNMSLVHVSGHPSKPELEKMYKWVKPEILIPVHGEFQHLKEHFHFAKNSGIKSSLLVENGDKVLLNKGNEESKVISKVLTGRKALKGNRILSFNKKVFNNLRVINSDGMISVVFVLNTSDELITDPEISALSILDDDDINEKKLIIKFLKNFIINIINSGVSDRMISEEIKKKLKNYIKQQYGVKPLIDIKLIRVQL